MNCPRCGANLAQTNAAGEPLLRNHGLVFKAAGMTVICPKCKGDVPMRAETLNRMHRRAVLFFAKKT